MATSIIDYVFRELAISYLGRHDLAHAEPHDVLPDAMGDGEQEKLLQLAGKTVSKGFVRSSNLYFINPQARTETTTAQTQQVTTTARAAGGGTVAEEVVNVRVTEVTQSRRAMQVETHKMARMKGYEGDACSDCGNFTLVRNGTCMKCETCGTTSGCS